MEYKLINPISTSVKIEQILHNRGIEDVEQFLNINEYNILAPELIPNIRDAAKMLVKHIAANNKVFIQIDEDCDGYTSAAVLMNYLHSIMPAFVENNIYYSPHNRKEHGVVLELIPEDTKLVIIPDAGSNQYEEHKILFDRGVDVLIIDHHEAESISPYACVVNNQLCSYPNKSLSGVGMVYKVCQYLDILLKIDNSKDFIDLVALGLIGDMMDTRTTETQALIQIGLNKIENAFFSSMIKKQAFKLEGGLTQEGVAFYIVPYINAVTRVGTYEDRIILFESLLDWKAHELIHSTKRGCKGQYEERVEQAIRITNNAKATKQKNAKEVGLEMAEQLICENNLLDNKILFITIPKDSVDKNINGLIANQLMSQYKRPVLVLQNYIEQETGDEYYAGSARGYEKSELKDFKKFLSQFSEIMYAEGHGNAFGTAVKTKDLDELIRKTNEALKHIEFSPAYDVDFIFTKETLRHDDIYEIADFNFLWGEKLDEPLIVVKNLTVRPENVRVLGTAKNTVRIDINGISYVKFLLTPEEVDKLTPSQSTYYTIDIIGKCQRNIWNGNSSPQIIIEDYEIKRRFFDF